MIMSRKKYIRGENMNLTEKFLTAEYYELSIISENISIVRNRKTGRLFIKKRIDKYSMEIYEKIKPLGIRGVPHIESIISVDGNVFVIYEYIQGLSVKEYIETNGALAEKTVDKYISSICESLVILHRNGIIHRDITASNVIITPNDECYLIDFGISRSVKNNKNADTEILGTVGYAPPEQFGFRQTDARSDLYSVGVLMNYMLTASMPNECTVNGSLGKIIAKCMAMEPDNRYSSAQELKQAVNKQTPKRKYITLFLLLFVLCIVLPQQSNVNEMLDFIIGYILLIVVPLTTAVDFFGIIDRLSHKYIWSRIERIGIRIVTIISAILIYAIISEFIQFV